MTDFDLRGFVGIRVVDGTPRDIAVVERQVGPIQRPLDRAPDITIRFVDRLAVRGPVRLLGLGEFAFTDDAFLAMRVRHKVAARVALPMDAVGSQCEIVCERGIPAVPFLVAIINLTALANGAVPIHGSAFVRNGSGILATGWAKGGKTETLLAFLDAGASYVGDEWVYLPGDGTMFGMPEPIRFWGWHLAQVPALAARINRSDRLRVGAIQRLADAMDRALARSPRPAPAAVQVLSRLAPLVRRQAAVQVPPAVAFGARTHVERARLDHLVLALSTEDDRYAAEQVDPVEVARRMAASVRFERIDFEAAYAAFRFAFPDRVNPVLETAAERELELLTRALAPISATRLSHPYPPRIELLHRTLVPALDESRPTEADRC